MSEESSGSRKIAIACQGGGSHAAFAAGALKKLLPTLTKEYCEIVAISGTSGGALCALVAWYGLLTGGTERAITLLERLWTANAAQKPGEVLLNTFSVRALEVPPWDVEFSPYAAPLRPLAQLSTSVWPTAVGIAPWLGEWVRGEYFRLDRLIEHCIDGDGDNADGFALIAVVCSFWSVLRLAQRWRVAEFGRTHGAAAEDRDALADLVRERLALWPRLEQAARRWPRGMLAGSLAGKGQPPQNALTTVRDFDALANFLKRVMRGVPDLLLGAIDVENGSFITFSATRAPTEYGITCEAALA